MSDERLASWISGLMRENYDAVGFIPEPTVEHRYVRQRRVVVQRDERGRRVGYLLHGEPTYGRVLSVAQHCIQYERRRHGYGEEALAELIRRVDAAGASAVRARVATDLDALEFWLSQGFQLCGVEDGGQKRHRTIARLWLPRALPLMDGAAS